MSELERIVICEACNKEKRLCEVKSGMYEGKETYICNLCYFDYILKIVKKEEYKKLKRKLKKLGTKPIIEKLRSIAFSDKPIINEYNRNLRKQALESLEIIEQLECDYDLTIHIEWIKYRYKKYNLEDIRKNINEHLNSIKKYWNVYRII